MCKSACLTRAFSLGIITISSFDSIALPSVSGVGMHGMRIIGFCHMTSPFCNLIGAWKFLNTDPRILPKFTRPFSSFWGWGLGTRLPLAARSLESASDAKNWQIKRFWRNPHNSCLWNAIRNLISPHFGLANEVHVCSS